MRYARLFIGGYDLSGDSRSFDRLENMFGFVDLTGWNQAIHNGLADKLRMMGVRGYSAFLNDAASGAFGVLKDPAAGLELSILFGGNAEPTYGDPAYLLAAVQMATQGAFDTGAAVINTDFLPESGISQDYPLGVVLFPHTLSLAATTNGTSVNNLASSAYGLHANLHVITTASGNFAFKIQHSTDDAIWADLVSFTINGSALASEHIAVTGTVNQYLRGVATRTAGTVTVVMTAARNQQ
jgi:hypothetical protein